MIISPGGEIILTDHLDVIAVGPANPPSAYATVTLTAKDIPIITITREELVVGAIPTLTEWGMIIFSVSLFGWMAWVIVNRRKQAVIT